MAYSLSNISAKNYRNRLMWVESIVCNISVVFSVVFRHSVVYYSSSITLRASMHRAITTGVIA